MPDHRGVCYKVCMRHVSLLSALVLIGCPRHPIKQADALSNTQWQGWINVSSPCEEHGGYTGTDLQVCMRFGQADGELIGVDVDWDGSQLRPACDYFVFAGAVGADSITLVRFESEESDDRFRLVRSGDRMVGTFQVHPSCEPWPVDLGLIPLIPSAAMRDPLQPPDTAAPASGSPSPEPTL